MGAWGEGSMDNDSAADLRHKIFDKLGLTESDFDSKECYHDFYYCEVLTSRDLKISFKSMLTDLLSDSIKETNRFETNHEAHCIAQFVIQNNIKLNKQQKNQLISIIQNENFDFWANPRKRKLMALNIIRDLNRI